MVVQEYLDRPFLINKLKFDLRLYVLLTSIRPLRLYLYEDGLVRFATKEYSSEVADIADKFIHITNFSVNKTNTDFVYNEQPGMYCVVITILYTSVQYRNICNQGNTRVTSGT